MSVSSPLKQLEKTETSRLGFWLYLLSDVMLFSALFATFMILRNSTAGGVSGADIFSPTYALVQTVALLGSSVTAAMALLAAQHKKSRGTVVGYLLATAVLGATFLGLELAEFSTLVNEGHSWQASAFLSSFFTLVGTHGLHISVGLLWLVVMLVRIMRQGITTDTVRKLGLFGLFWHFLDLVWIWLFTIVYLFGVSQ